MDVRIYHNPRCTKSRQTLALLREHGIDAIDLLCVNLYRFRETAGQPGISRDAVVENIDLSPHYREGEDAAAADQLARIDPGLIEFDYSEFDGPGGRGGGMGQSVALELAPLLPIFQTMF